MAFSRSFGPIAAKGRSAAEKDLDLERLRYLVEQMPGPDIEQAIAKELKRRDTAEVSRGFGSFEEVARLAEEQGMSAEARTWLANAWSESLPHDEADPTEIRDEATTASYALVRHWVNGLIRARKILQSPVLLSLESFLPIPEGEFRGSFAIWDQHRRVSRASMLSSVALADGDIDVLMSKFAGKLAGYIEAGLALPGGISIVGQDSRPYLVAQKDLAERHPGLVELPVVTTSSPH